MPKPFNKNSLDNLLIYNLLENTPNICKLTPNYITLINVLITIIILRLLYLKQHVVVLILLVIINRILDCMDGTIARKCNKFSKIGNFIDHANDYVSTCVPLLIILYKYPALNSIMKIILLLGLIILTILYSITSTHSTINQVKFVYNNPISIILHDNSVLVYLIYMVAIFYFKDIMKLINISI